MVDQDQDDHQAYEKKLRHSYNVIDRPAYEHKNFLATKDV
jgi:hypothetical protein